MAFVTSIPAKNAGLTAQIALIDAQSTPGKLEFYNGSTILADVVFQKPSATVSNGVATFTGFPITCTVAATGTAVSARVIDGNGNVLFDQLVVGTANSDVNLNTTSLVQNQNLTINSFSIKAN